MGGDWTGQPIWSGKGDVTSAATVQHVLEGFLTDWAVEDYPAMYARLTRLSRDAITLEEFTRIYENFAQTLTLESIQTQVLSTLAEANHAEAAYRVAYYTRLFGILSRDTVATLTREPDGWRIQWETGMLLPDLRGGNRLDFVSQLPSRGRIFDRSGAPLAAYENALAIGVVPGEILPEQAPDLFAALAEISIYSSDSLGRLVESTPDDWYLPVVSLSQAAAVPYLEHLQSFYGVRISEFRSRFYLDGGVAPHAWGICCIFPKNCWTIICGGATVRTNALALMVWKPPSRRSWLAYTVALCMSKAPVDRLFRCWRPVNLLPGCPSPPRWIKPCKRTCKPPWATCAQPWW